MSSQNNGRCLVCGDVSIGVNFGIPTCMPCKAFFRRNAVTLGKKDFVCKYDGDCLITYKYRRSCNCCRLAKCFRVGMKKSMILTDEDREARNKLVETNRLKRGRIPKRECVRWMQSTSLLPITQNSTQYLSPSDQVILANIFNAYENTCITAKNSQIPCFPVVQHTSLHTFLNEIGMIVPAYCGYFKRIPEFTNIPMNDKLRLVKNHFRDMININEPVLYRATSSNLVATWMNVFGLNITERLLKRNQIIEQYTRDPILLKLVLIILMLSGSTTRNLDSPDIGGICDDILSIFAAQNVYVGLLWRYILSRTSHERDAIRFLNKLIMFILYVKDLDEAIDSFINSSKDEVQQMKPLIKNMWPTPNNKQEMTDITV